MNKWRGLNELETESEGSGKRGETMKVHKIGNLVGIYEENRTVRCRDCMEEEDWKDIKQENIITLNDIKDGEKWLY